jgi:curved DNA-binding protein CbpA
MRYGESAGNSIVFSFFRMTHMAQVHTHYDNLKVARNAPPEVIRAAYKTLSKKYHPDHNPNNPEAIRIIQLINAAYDVLSDPVRREEHDKWIESAEAQQLQNRSTWGFSNVPPERGSSERTRRNSPVGKRHSSRHRSSRAPRFLQKLLFALDQFSRFISKKA